MTVDKIEPLDKRRSKVFIDEDFAFVLYKGELKKYQIEEGAELAEDRYEEIMKQVIGKRTRERALYLLKSTGKTEAELRRKLLSAFYPAEAIDAAVKFLKEYHYLDDTEYARNYIEAYGRRKSRTDLMGTLLRKGVEKSLILELLTEQPPDEEAIIRRLLEKRRYGVDASQAEKQKTVAALMRKGFSYDQIRRVMGDLGGEEPCF